MESKKAEIKVRVYNGNCQGLGSRGNQETLVKGYKVVVMRGELVQRSNAWHDTYSNRAVLNAGNTLREQNSGAFVAKVTEMMCQLA